MKKILVTGGFGYIGSMFCNLYQDKYDIKVLDKGLFGNYINTRVTPIVKDIRKVSIKDLENIEYVIHMAELSNDPLGELQGEITNEINHLATVRLLNMCEESSVKKFIYMSSCSVYGFNENIVDENSSVNPLTNYSKSKILNENFIIKNNFSFQTTILRNATVFGYAPNMRLDLVINDISYNAYKTGKIELISDGKPIRPFIHVHDLSRLIEYFLNNESNYQYEIFNAGSNLMNYSIKELAEFLKNYLKTEEVKYGKFDPDQRSYNVNFNKLNEFLPSFSFKYNLENGVANLIDNFDKYVETLDSKRIKKLKFLLENGEINKSFY